MADPFLVLDLPDETATQALAAKIAPLLAAGDVIALWGDLGAGKSTFARALIRTLADDPELEVPSPTFTLVQPYRTPRLAVTHIDLYRVSDFRDIDEIGLLDALAEGAALIEWPERAGPLLPVERLDLALAIRGGGRQARIGGTPEWAKRLAGIG